MAQDMGFSTNPLQAAILGPDLLRQQYQLQQSQQLAQGLINDQGFQPNQGQMVSGHYIPPNAGVAISNALRAYAGYKGMQDGPKQAADLGTAMMQRQGAMFGLGGTPPAQQQPSMLSGQMGSDGQPVQNAQPDVQTSPVSAAGQPPLPQMSVDGQASTPINGQPSPQAPAGVQPTAPANGQSSPQALASALSGKPMMPLLPGKTAQESMMAYNFMGPQAYMAAVTAQGAPTDIQKQLASMGIQPGSAQYNQAMGGVITKAGYTPPTNIRGVGYVDPSGLHTVPNPTTGTMPVQLPNGQWVLQTVPGAAAAASAMEAGRKAGANSQTVGGVQFGPDGNPLPTATVGQQVGAITGTAPMRNNNPGAMMPGGKLANYPDMQTGLAALDNNLASYGKQGVNTLAGVISKWAPPNENNTQAYIADAAQRLGINPNQKIDLTNPMVRQAVGTAIALHENGSSGVFGNTQSSPIVGTPEQNPGVNTNARVAATNMQDQVATSFKTVSANNAQAQTTQALLQNIGGLADRAIVGPASDKLAYMNGLLSFVNQRATDATTATDLLHKYQNQIVAQLGGSGALGTDAGRAIVEAGNPNSNMNAPAIHEAIQYLVAASRMNQAKSSTLTPLRNSGNAQSYLSTEQQFDANADPRMWEYNAMPAGPAKDAFAQNLIKSDPKFMQKASVIAKMGALQ